MALRAGYKGIKKYIADMLNAMSPGDGIVTDQEIASAISGVESVIGPVEDGDTASQAYSIGEHFIKDGKFCTVIQAIAAEATLTEDTNYTVGDVAKILNQVNGAITITEAGTAAGITSVNTDIKKVGNTVAFSMRFTLSQPVTSGVAFANLGFIPLLAESVKLPIFSTTTLEMATIAYIDATGRLHLYSSVNLSADSYTISGVYLSK